MPNYNAGNLTRIKTTTISVGSSYTTDVGSRGIDMLYYGTLDSVTFLGVMTGSIPVSLPPSVPYTLEYNEKGYDEVTITNNGDADVYIVEKF
jgi:hypothetical protein